MGILLKNAIESENEEKIFEAKIRGYELEKPVEVSPMKQEDWGIVLKQIKKNQLDYERNKKIININRMR